MPRRHLAWLVIAANGLIALAVVLFPVSYRSTRLILLAALIALWFGLVALAWHRRRLRLTLLAAPIFLGGFILLPLGHAPAPGDLRAAYLRNLRRYEGVRYVWGGESPLGIDCSGLVRRGMIDAQAVLGVQRLSPLLLRRSAVLWWRDCTAQALGDPATGWTRPVTEARSLNELAYDTLQAGDLALVAGGSHIMAYLGDCTWIEADPEKQRVLIVRVPSNTSWFTVHAQIVRWRTLDFQ